MGGGHKRRRRKRIAASEAKQPQCWDAGTQLHWLRQEVAKDCSSSGAKDILCRDKVKLKPRAAKAWSKTPYQTRSKANKAQRLEMFIQKGPG
ncbi:hypothetical protein LEMLEM_LOCUS10392 [Lemmus lemmus]